MATRERSIFHHSHAPNRFAVIATPDRLGAVTEYAGRGVTIAFLDSGFYPHPDLTLPHNRIRAYHDVTRPASRLSAARPSSWAWHGTQTSVAAAGNGHLSNGYYRAVASEAEVVLVKVSDQGRISDENIVRGFEWVLANRQRYGIRIVNASLGGDRDESFRESLVDEIAEEAVRAGLIIVVAAGNSGCSENPRPTPPANSPSVITVGGYDDHNRLAARDYDLYCSNFGLTIDGLVKPELIAPAVWVPAPILPRTRDAARAAVLAQLATAPDFLLPDLVAKFGAEAELPEDLSAEQPRAIRAVIDETIERLKIVSAHYQHVDGTSFASPMTASVIAQMLEANPRLTPAAVKHLLVSTAERIAGQAAPRQGFGVLNARRAVNEAQRERHAAADFTPHPPRLVGARIIFKYHNHQAERVCLAGDFNDWDEGRHALLRDEDGLWGLELPALPPGQYRYKFVLNGERWIEDPANAFMEPDEFGGFNSLISIG